MPRSQCRHGEDGLWAATPLGPSLGRLGRLATAFAWFLQEPTASPLSPFMSSGSGPDARSAAHSIHVLSLDQETISTITMFVPPTGPNLFKSFELPLILPDVGDASTPHHS